MEQERIDLFISSLIDKFPPDQLGNIRHHLEKTDDSKLNFLQSLPYKNPIVLLIVSLLVGSLGIDRFLLGHVGLGVLKLITCGGFGIWYIVDWFLVMGLAKEANYQLFMKNAVEF